jgi:hypothetical protein
MSFLEARYTILLVVIAPVTIGVQYAALVQLGALRLEPVTERILTTTHKLLASSYELSAPHGTNRLVA